ncbi:hypothetical protein CR152_04110 [Massilia violaceinigra]|uniref:Aerotolerance regulator N-terminal domain-containing protein n=1 Tax=Massilia violaceinigra TaxID=2045208 RepID=A0A2D2DFM3_9BURK|nr:BatA domain-containing protein [Massilia violaceinigra]ATQ73784.1 hypothetical protein CR152_04110 [Massilia violaceinigra]
MNALWWLGLGLLALPVLWHRQRRQRIRQEPLATARFLPRADPQQLRVWHWTERLLLLARCLLLVAVIAWLADLVLPWRRDAVLIPAGTDSVWAERQIKQAGLYDASWIAVPGGDPFAWLARHDREWRPDARLLVLGNVPMPAMLPRSRHRIEVRSRAPSFASTEQRVVVVSKRAVQWRAMFAALDGPRRYKVDDAPDGAAELVVWDVPQAPPASLRAPLWWAGDESSFPELKKAAQADDIRYADSARGRVWASNAWPPAGPQAARRLFESWQRLHYAPVPYTMPSQPIAPTTSVTPLQSSGALRYLLTLILLGLFAVERILAHASRR